MEDKENKAKIIDLVQRQKELASKRNQGRKTKGGLPQNAHRIAMFKTMAKQAVLEGAQERLTEAEKLFAELTTSGASLVEAYRQAFPEKAFMLVKDCSHQPDKDCTEACERVVEAMSYEQCYSRANALAKRPDVRSAIISSLEQHEGEISHTASRLDNFIVKRLEAEAADPNNTASARIAALKALSEHRAVAVAEGKAAEKAAATSEEVLERISDRVRQLTGGKREL